MALCPVRGCVFHLTLMLVLSPCLVFPSTPLHPPTFFWSRVPFLCPFLSLFFVIFLLEICKQSADSRASLPHDWKALGRNLKGKKAISASLECWNVFRLRPQFDRQLWATLSLEKCQLFLCYLSYYIYIYIYTHLYIHTHICICVFI